MAIVRTSIFLCVALSGCAAAPKEIFTADGHKGHVIDCSPKMKTFGRALMAASGPQVMGNAAASMPPPQADFSSCLATAGEICGTRGYAVLDRSEERGALVVQCNGE